MGRGGQRQGAGRKSGWKNPETQTIRVPKIFAAQILEYARQLDSADEFELVVETSPLDPEVAPENDEAPGQMPLFDFVEIIRVSDYVDSNDFVSKSKPLPLQGIELARRLRVNRGVPSNMKKRQTPQKFVEWSRSKDPDGIGWLWNERLKLFEPIFDSHLHDDF